MDWHVLQDHLTSTHDGRPQNQRRIEHALRDVQEGLRALASLGHSYHLEEGPSPPSRGWPRTYYHLESAPQGRLINSGFDLDELGDGWYSSLDLARHMDGLRQQFLGRGGVSLGGLPALAPQPPSPGEHPGTYLLVRNAREGFIVAELQLRWVPVNRATLQYRTLDGTLAQVVTDEAQLTDVGSANVLVSSSMPKAEDLCQLILGAKVLRPVCEE